MYEEFITEINAGFQQKGFLTQLNPRLDRARGLLYARSPQPVRLAFAKVDDHFLFVDWEADLFGRLDLFLETHRAFSAAVNKTYKVPRVWRMRIPNLVTVAVSGGEFPKQAVEAARFKYMIPWQGGEVGQLMLLELPARRLYHHVAPGYKQTGSMPLLHAEELIKSVM